jgi:pimeloyl-ACP methyl ester carboxylesterase
MRGYVTTDWGQLHYRAAGPDPRDGGPVAVFFHESPRSSLVYEPALAELGESLSVIAFDTPGFGQSDSAPTDATIPDYGRIFLQAIDALNIDKFTVVGMKTGGMMATQVATEAGIDRVSRAVLYIFNRPEPGESEHMLRTWAPDLEIEETGEIFARLWSKNVGIYGTDSPADIALTVAETVVNIDRYNSAYPAYFRYWDTAYDLNQTLLEAGVAITMLQPPSAAHDKDHPIVHVPVPGVTIVQMPVTGQFASRARAEFIDVVLTAALSSIPRAATVAP